MSDLRGHKRDSGDRDGLGRQAGICPSMWYRRIAIVGLVGLGLATAFAPDLRAQGERFQSTSLRGTMSWNSAVLGETCTAEPTSRVRFDSSDAVNETSEEISWIIPLAGQCANGSFTGQLSVTLPAELSNATRDPAADVWVLGTPITPVVSLTGTWSDFEGVLTSQLASTVEPCLVMDQNPDPSLTVNCPAERLRDSSSSVTRSGSLNYNYFSFLNDSSSNERLSGFAGNMTMTYTFETALPTDSIRIVNPRINGKAAPDGTTILTGPITFVGDVAYNLETDPAGGALSVQAVGKVNGETVELGTPILRLVDPTSVETTESGLTLSFQVPGKVTEVQIIAALVDSSLGNVLASETLNYPTDRTDSIRLVNPTIDGQAAPDGTTVPTGPITFVTDVSYNLLSDPDGGALSVQAKGMSGDGDSVELGTPILLFVDPTDEESTEKGLTLSFQVAEDVTEVQIIAALVDSSASAVLASTTINYPTLSRTLDVAVVAHENGFKDPIPDPLIIPAGRSLTSLIQAICVGNDPENDEPECFGLSMGFSIESDLSNETGALEFDLILTEELRDGTVKRGPNILESVQRATGSNEEVIIAIAHLVPSDVDLWRFRVRLTRADDTETFSREILMPINRVSVARGVTPLTRSNNLQQGSNVDFFYPIEFNVNGSATLEAELVFKTGSFFPVVKVVPLGQFADGFHPKSTFQFSETIPLDATSFSVWVSLSGTPLPARADKKVYASIRAPEFAIPTFVNQTAGVLGLDLTPVQAGLNRSVDVIRNRRNLLTSALDVLSTTTTSPTDTSTSALPEGVGSPFPDFVQTASYWQIVPPVSGEVFTGDLTLHYSEEDLPDDLGFFEEDLQIVSVDSSGVFRTHETTVDLDVLTATTRVAGLESVYGLAVVGPFFERTLNFPVLRSTFDLFTGLAFLNLGIDTAGLELYAFDPAGIEYDAAENDGVVFLEPGEQLPRLARELFDFQTSNNEGWVQVYSDTPDVVGFELLSNATVLDGVDVKAALAPTVVLTRIEYDDDRSTEIHVGNPTIFDNPVEIELWTSSGIVETYETTLGAKEKAEHRIEDLFPGLTKGFVGYAIVRGDYDVSAVELLVTEDSMAALNGQVRIPGSSVSEELYSAQLATGGGASETRLNVVNTTGLAAGLVVRAVGENGASLAPAVNVQLGPGEQLERDVGPLFGFDSNVLTVGSIVIESSITGILGDVAFGDPSSARAFRASLPLDPRPSKTAAFAQVANGAGFFTGFAAFNPNGSATAVTIATFAANGASTGSGSLNLAAGGRVSKLLPEVVASSAGQVGGYFTVTSDLPISSFSLFGTQTLSALSAVPAQGRDLTVQ